MATSTSRTRLKKIETVNELFAVATYEAIRDGVVLGTITKYDEPAHKTVKKRGKLRVKDYRIISWQHSRCVAYDAQETRGDCIADLERRAGVSA